MSTDAVKPAGLSPEYGGQFQDRSIIESYRFRKPYPAETFSFLAQLAKAESPTILDLGCGSGDLTWGLSRFAKHIDAVDMSEGMLDLAKARAMPANNVRWIHSPAETAPLLGPYDLATAGQSLHWMEWPSLFAKLKTVLKPRAFVAIVGRDYVDNSWWNAHFQSIVERYSTNRDYQSYDLNEELERLGVFKMVGEHKTAAIPFRQKIEDLIEAFHSRNGFSRDRMGEEAAEGFDRHAFEHFSQFADDGFLELGVVSTISWGTLR